MKKIILSCTIFLLIFTACKKDSGSGSSGGGTDALSGTWKFTSLTAQTEVTDEYNVSGDDFKYVTTSNYNSENAAGTIAFSSGTATSTGVSYSVDTAVYLASYENNVFIENDTSAFQVTIPSSSSTASYKVIGTDSVFFANGFVTSTDLTGGAPQPATPVGYKFNISGSVLTMTSAIVKDTTENVGGGIVAQVHETANFSVTLTKQ